jgi:hypothetical protein
MVGSPESADSPTMNLPADTRNGFCFSGGSSSLAA